MTLIPITCEARLMGFSKQARADGDWTELRVHIHPDDTPHALFLLPLKTHIKLSISGVDEPANEPPASPAPADTATPSPLKGGARAKRAWDDVSPREQACIRCNEAEFGTWLRQYLHADAQNSVDIPVLVRTYCGVNSRSELLPDSTGARFWAVLDEEYQDYIGQQRYDALETQRDGGPG